MTKFNGMLTAFIRIVAVATTNFSLIGVRLLVEDGCYLRVAFIDFRTILPGAIHKNKNGKD